MPFVVSGLWKPCYGLSNGFKKAPEKVLFLCQLNVCFMNIIVLKCIKFVINWARAIGEADTPCAAAYFRHT